jgi:hypothetical protein
MRLRALVLVEDQLAALAPVGGHGGPSVSDGAGYEYGSTVQQRAPERRGRGARTSVFHPGGTTTAVLGGCR